MKTLIIGSVSKSAGKTSVIVGIARASGKTFGYLKPFGDRLTYRKKRLWDYDAALITNIFGLSESSEDATIGFEHSKIKYMYDEEGIKAKLLEMAGKFKDRDILFVEGGKVLSYGSSLRLNTISLARYMGGRLIVVVGGEESDIDDQVTFIKRYVDMSQIDFAGIIINKVRNIEEYKNTHLPYITSLGINVLGIIPNNEDLTYPSVGYLAERLQARVIAGENGLSRKVKNIFVGAMAVDAAIRLPLFRKENKLAITGGDRSDMILAALQSDTSGIILTNNIVPPSNILAKASDLGIPLLTVPIDTYQIARQIENMDFLLTRDDTERIEVLAKLVKDNVKLDEIV